MGRTAEHAPQSFTGFDRLADRAVAWLAERRREAREAEAARRAENPPPLYPRGRWEAMSLEARAGLWDAYDSATSAALGSPSIMTYGAAAARLGNAGRFAAMSRRGAGDAAIRRATRYERGPFGYGVETRGDATLRPAAVFGAVREGSLGDLAYIHPEVARAYPTMRDVKVEMVPSAEWADRLAAARAASAEAGGAGSTGAYAKTTDTILVKGPSETEPLHMFADRADRTLVHEMQHAAQARDGILGKTAGDYRTAAKEVDARNSANRRWLGPAERREMPREATQDVRPEEVHMDDKGGEDINGRHGNFTNFLATDDVPESIFGIPVVQDESQYTEKDLAFFRENPKAAGFYETGDEGDVGSQEAWGGADTLDDVREMTGRWREAHDRGLPMASVSATTPNFRPLPSMSEFREQATQGGNGDPDAMLGRADRNPIVIAGQMAGAPAAVVSTAFGVAKAVHDVKSGHPEELIPTAISLLPGLKLNRLMFASREAPSTMEFLLYDRNNPEAAPRVLEVPYKSSAIGALSPARAGSTDKLASVFAKSPEKFVDILKDGPEKTSLLDYYPEISDTEFLIGSDMWDGMLGVALRNPGTGKPAIVLSKDYLRKGGIETVDGLPVEPLDVVAHEGGAHIPQMIADAYTGTIPDNVFSQAHKDAIAAMVGGERIKVSPRSADNMINYGRLENAIKATYPEDVRNAFFLEPDTTDKGILYSLMDDEVKYNAYRNTAGEIHAFDIGARSADPKLRSEPVKELPENALRFRNSDYLDTNQAAKGGNTRSGAGAGETAEDVHGLVQKFKDHVRTYENRRVEPYRDVDGNWAVGYGSHYLADGTKVTPRTAVTDRMIDDAFDADLARRIDLLAGHDRRQARFAVPNWRYMSPESRLMLLDVSWGRKDTLTEKKSPGLFGELRAAGRDKAALDDAVKRHYLSYRKATDANGAVDESKTAGLQNRRIALLKALTGEDFSYDGKKWSTEKNKFVEE